MLKHQTHHYDSDEICELLNEWIKTHAGLYIWQQRSMLTLVQVIALCSLGNNLLPEPRQTHSSGPLNSQRN